MRALQGWSEYSIEVTNKYSKKVAAEVEIDGKMVSLPPLLIHHGKRIIDGFITRRNTPNLG